MLAEMLTYYTIRIQELCTYHVKLRCLGSRGKKNKSASYTFQ